MPLYEYRCDKCGNVFEVRQKFSDEPLTTHEACGGPVQRLISAPAFQFKGSGWYVTDYAKSSNSGTNGEGGKGGSGDKSGSGDKTGDKIDKKETSASSAAKDASSSSSSSPAASGKTE